MADYTARVLPFINKEAIVTAKAGVYPDGSYHSGLDLATGGNDILYSICNGTVIQKAYNKGGYGNYIIIKDNNSDYAFLFAHMKNASNKNIGDNISIGEQFGIEGATGNVTGIHVHIEMQNYVQNGNTWIYDAYNPALWGSVYLPATQYMGFPNELGISVVYHGYVPPTPHIFKTHKFKWVLYANKLRKQMLTNRRK